MALVSYTSTIQLTAPIITAQPKKSVKYSRTSLTGLSFCEKLGCQKLSRGKWRLCPINGIPYKRHDRTGVAANASAARRPAGFEDRLTARSNSDRRAACWPPQLGEDLVVTKDSDIIGNIAS